MQSSAEAAGAKDAAMVAVAVAMAVAEEDKACVRTWLWRWRRAGWWAWARQRRGWCGGKGGAGGGGGCGGGGAMADRKSNRLSEGRASLSRANVGFGSPVQPKAGASRSPAEIMVAATTERKPTNLPMCTCR